MCYAVAGGPALPRTLGVGAVLQETGMNYRIGFPGWKIAARRGARMYFRVWVHKDDTSNTYWAESDDLDGLAVAGDTLDDVERAIEEVAPVLYKALLNGDAGHSNARAKMSYSVSLPCPA